MRYYITPTGLERIDDDERHRLFLRMKIPYLERSPATLAVFDLMVSSPVFLFKRQDVKDDDLYPLHNKTAGTNMYLTDVRRYTQIANLYIIVRDVFYSQSEGFVRNVFRVSPSIVDGMLRQFHIDEFLADNP